MAVDANTVVSAVNIAQPLVFAIIAAIRAHHNATGVFPTNEQILAAIPLEGNDIRLMWDNWTATHPAVPSVAETKAP